MAGITPEEHVLATVEKNQVTGPDDYFTHAKIRMLLSTHGNLNKRAVDEAVYELIGAGQLEVDESSLDPEYALALEGGDFKETDIPPTDLRVRIA